MRREISHLSQRQKAAVSRRTPNSNWLRRFGLSAAAVAISLPAATVDPALPPYEPQPVEFPAGASYVDATGAIAIVGYNDMLELLTALDARFAADHPGFKFTRAARLPDRARLAESAR